MVDYNEYFADGSVKKRDEEDCFSKIYHNYPKAEERNTVRITYTCLAAKETPSGETLTLQDIQKYCEFLKECLNKDQFTFVIRGGGKKGSIKIDWDLNTKGLSRPLALLYLAAFRYPDEYTSYVKAVGRSTETVISEQFKEFVTWHIKSTEENSGFEYADGAHSLMCFDMKRKKDRQPIPFKDFQLNLKNDTCNSVTDFWQNSSKIEEKLP
jgi:hypothetical protein